MTQQLGIIKNKMEYLSKYDMEIFSQIFFN